MAHYHSLHRPAASRGSALSLAIVMSVILTSLVAALAWTAGVQSQTTAKLAKLDQAFFAAETGAQQVAWYCRNHTIGTLRSPMTGTVNGYTYSVSWLQGTNYSAHLTSVGTDGTASYTLSEYIAPSVNIVPAFATAGDFSNKNITITGDVATGGSYTNAGNGTLSGDLYYAGTAAGLADVWGIIYPSNAFTAIDFTALNTTLSASAIPMLPTGPFNFAFVPGTNKVIIVTGDVTDPSITGSGTLYVKGKVHFTNPNITVGSANSPVNLVATDDITFDKSSTFYGSIYTKTNLNRAEIDIFGTVYAGGVFSPSNTGISSFTVGTTPWFDPRATAAGPSGTTLTFANFKGPQS